MYLKKTFRMCGGEKDTQNSALRGRDLVCIFTDYLNHEASMQRPLNYILEVGWMGTKSMTQSAFRHAHAQQKNFYWICSYKNSIEDWVREQAKKKEKKEKTSR